MLLAALCSDEGQWSGRDLGLRSLLVAKQSSRSRVALGKGGMLIHPSQQTANDHQCRHNTYERRRKAIHD